MDIISYGIYPTKGTTSLSRDANRGIAEYSFTENTGNIVVSHINNCTDMFRFGVFTATIVSCSNVRAIHFQIISSNNIAVGQLDIDSPSAGRSAEVDLERVSNASAFSAGGVKGGIYLVPSNKRQASSATVNIEMHRSYNVPVFRPGDIIYTPATNTYMDKLIRFSTPQYNYIPLGGQTILQSSLNGVPFAKITSMANGNITGMQTLVSCINSNSRQPYLSRIEDFPHYTSVVSATDCFTFAFVRYQ